MSSEKRDILVRAARVKMAFDESSSALDTDSTPPSTTFTHLFQGWSVWLEPCETGSDALVQEIQFLSEECGGADCGMHPFLPHCTLLYNIQHPTAKTSDGGEEGTLQSKEQAG